MKNRLFTLLFSIVALSAYGEAPSFTPDPERYDSLSTLWHGENLSASYDHFYREFIDLDTVQVDLTQALPDSLYMARLRTMLSPINLPYNEVLKKWLVTYTTTRRTTMANILGRAEHYFPMIEQELAAHGLPIELRMMPVIESALVPTAVSRMRATGLWQFMYNTGKIYDLEITSFVDQRLDPVAATKAACAHLRDLYNIYGEWTLVIAAYNCGSGNVNKALKRAGAGAKNFWDIYQYLPSETRGYVPSFVAASYAYYYSRQHAISPVPMARPVPTDTVMVDRLMHFSQVATTIGMPLEQLRALNPQYSRDIIPAVGGKSYVLTLPSHHAIRYIEHQDSIFAKDSLYLAEYLKQSQPLTSAQFAEAAGRTHRVRSGETLSGIARRYGTSVAQIKRLNGLKSDRINIGKVLKIN